jgi:hypothetical protein
MRKSLILTLFLALVAVPAFAQQSDVEAPGETRAMAAAAAEVPSAEASERAPTIHVSQDEIREAVRANERELASEQSIMQSDTWLAVAVIAGAVAIALILLR